MTTARVIPIAPLCFATRGAWVEFVTAADAVKEGADAAPRPWIKNGQTWNPEFHPCTDCSREYEAAMVAERRCQRGAFPWTPRAAQGSLLETA